MKLKIVLIFLMWVSNTTYGIAQQPQPINFLKLKATHNSYASSGHSSFLGVEYGNSCPIINSPPPEQIDDYGVWGIELDFDIKLGILTIGHDGGSGQNETWAPDSWGITVEEYLRRVKETRAFKEKYRPIFIRFGKKCWGDSNQSNASNNPNNWFQKLKSMLVNVFGAENIFGKAEQLQKGWLNVKELGGKIIPSTSGECDPEISNYFDDIIFWGEPVLRGLLEKGDNKSPTIRNNAINSTNPNWTLISQDLHQNDWTFEGTAPPNPIYVVQNAPETYTIVNIFGDDCSDGTDRGEPFIVHQQGTFKLPYDKIGESVDKALAGWTILMKAGNYNEKIIISKALTLKADKGIVIIGR
jgi:hypothetical protein